MGTPELVLELLILLRGFVFFCLKKYALWTEPYGQVCLHCPFRNDFFFWFLHCEISSIEHNSGFSVVENCVDCLITKVYQSNIIKILGNYMLRSQSSFGIFLQYNFCMLLTRIVKFFYHNNITFCCPEIRLNHTREPCLELNAFVISSNIYLNRELSLQFVIVIE